MAHGRRGWAVSALAAPGIMAKSLTSQAEDYPNAFAKAIVAAMEAQFDFDTRAMYGAP